MTEPQTTEPVIDDHSAQPTPVDLSGYDVDMETLMGSLGIDPAIVQKDTAKIAFVENKIILTYSVIRAIPTRLLGAALLRAGTHQDEQ